MRALALAAALLVAGCATTQQQEDPLMWTRIDGQRMTGNPALEVQLETDKVVCEGETQKANLSGSSYCRGLVDCVATGIQRGNAMQSVAKGCMADRGYMLMPKSQGDAHIAAAEASRRVPPAKPALRAPIKPKQATPPAS